MNEADWPLEEATAAVPPSSAAIRCSNTSCVHVIVIDQSYSVIIKLSCEPTTVGLPMREHTFPGTLHATMEQILRAGRMSHT